MADLTKLSLEEIASAIANIDKAIRDNADMVVQLDKIIAALGVAWESQTQVAYAEAYAGYKKNVLPRFDALLQTYRATLVDTANALGADDSTFAKMVASAMAR